MNGSDVLSGVDSITGVLFLYSILCFLTFELWTYIAVLSIRQRIIFQMNKQFWEPQYMIS